MNDVLIVSCRLCMQPDEEPSLVTIERPLASTGQSARLSICRPCARAAAAEIKRLDDEDAQEVHIDVAVSSSDSPAGGGDPAPAEADPPLVPENQPGADAPALDRLEPQVPAGGEGTKRETPEG